jgi:hypothetical protein
MSNSPEDVNEQDPTEALPKLKISCAEDLFTALRADTIGVRLSVLSAISRAPEKTLSYGPYHGRHLLGEMIDQLKTTPYPLLRRALLFALSAFKDSSVVEAMKSYFRTSHDAQEVIICTRRLAEEPEHDVRAFFVKFIERGIRSNQARCAANILARLDGHCPGDAVRIAVLSDIPFTTPPLDESTENYWYEALCGPFVKKTQILIESLGEPAFRHLRRNWDYLSIDIRIWLFDWGGRSHKALTVALCLKTFEEEGPDALSLSALKTAAIVGTSVEIFRSHATKLFNSTNPEIRAAALLAGADIADVRAALAVEADLETRLKLIPRLADAYGETAIDDLVHLLEDKDWRIRNIATATLVSFGKAAVHAMESILDHEQPAVRVAANQVLIAVSG